jgi:hypothetical protein
MVLDLVGIVASTTLPIIAKYLVSRINKWIESKTSIDPGSSEIKALASDVQDMEKKAESNSYTATQKDVEDLKHTIKKVEDIQQETTSPVISTTDFRDWALQGLKEGQLTSEEVVAVTVHQLEVLAQKLRDNGAPRERITEVVDMIVALKTNLQFLQKRERSYRLSGLRNDEEKAMESQITLQRSLLEARSVIEKYQ